MKNYLVFIIFFISCRRLQFLGHHSHPPMYFTGNQKYQEILIEKDSLNVTCEVRILKFLNKDSTHFNNKVFVEFQLKNLSKQELYANLESYSIDFYSKKFNTVDAKDGIEHGIFIKSNKIEKFQINLNFKEIFDPSFNFEKSEIHLNKVVFNLNGHLIHGNKMKFICITH